MLIPRRAILLIAALIAAGCSDGKLVASLNYTGPTALVAISSETDGDRVASSVVALESTSSALSDAAAIVPIGVVATSSVPQFGLSSLGTLARQYANQALVTAPAGTTPLAGITTSKTNSCSGGGTVTLSATYSVQNEVNPGDTVSMTLSNCIQDTKQTNGIVSLTISTFDQVTRNFSASFAFTNLKTTTTSSGDYVWLHGGFTASFSGDGTTTPLVASLSGNALTVEERSSGVVTQAMLSNFSFADTLAINGDFSFDHNYTIASTRIGGSIVVATETPFIVYSGDSYPTVGRVVATGAAGASIRLSALDNLTALLEYDLGGDGIYGNETIDPASKVVNWADF